MWKKKSIWFPYQTDYGWVSFKFKPFRDVFSNKYGNINELDLMRSECFTFETKKTSEKAIKEFAETLKKDYADAVELSKEKPGKQLKAVTDSVKEVVKLAYPDDVEKQTKTLDKILPKINHDSIQVRNENYRLFVSALDKFMKMHLSSKENVIDSIVDKSMTVLPVWFDNKISDVKGDGGISIPIVCPVTNKEYKFDCTLLDQVGWATMGDEQKQAWNAEYNDGELIENWYDLLDDEDKYKVMNARFFSQFEQWESAFLAHCNVSYRSWQRALQLKSILPELLEN